MPNLFKILVIGDQHLDVTTPRSRKDDYCEALFAKLEEIHSLAVEREADHIIWLGDMFHRQDAVRVPHVLVNRLIHYFKRLKRSKIRSLVVMGNHDIRSTAENWRRQPIATLVAADVITPLWTDSLDTDPWGKVSVEIVPPDTKSPFGHRVVVHGAQFSYDADHPTYRADFYSIDRDEEAFNIRTLHTTLMPSGQSTFGDFTTVDDLTELPSDKCADLYLCGHVHLNLDAFETEIEQGKPHIVAYNPGALARGSLEEYNISRPVQVGELVLSYDGDSVQCSISSIPLKSAKPAEEIFMIDEHLERKLAENAKDSMASMLNAANLIKDFGSLDFKSSWESYVDQAPIQDRTKVLLTQLIRDGEQE